MLKNFLLLATRNLLKRKVYSFINIFGLAIGVAVCLVILKYVDFEMSYDSFHKQAAHIYRVNNEYYQNGELKGESVISAYALGPSLLADIPEVKTYVRTHPMYGGVVVSYKRDAGDPSTFYEEKVQMADSTFFDVFTYQSIQGDLSLALDDPNSIVITKSVAEKYFGRDEDPIGRVLNLTGGWSDGDYQVTAVIEDTPQNSHFPFDFILPIHNVLTTNNQYIQDNGWGWNNFVTYVELHATASVGSAEEKLPAFVEKHRKADLERVKNSRIVVKLQPVRDIHITPGLMYETQPAISSQTIYFFIVISIFILAIAWVNYINLSTARAMERAREVGIKKAVGAFRSQLIFQFIFESILVNFLGVALALGIAIGLLPLLGEIVNKDLFFDFSDYRFWGILGALFVFGSLVSGAYPAFVLSSFNTTDVLKGRSGKTIGGFSLRKALVVFQFASSLILIAGTFAVYRQVMYMRNADKGLTMDQMLIVNGPKTRGEGMRQRLITFKDELKKIPGITDVATSGAVPGGGHNWGTVIRKEGVPVEQQTNGGIVWIDPDFIETYGITVLSGRTFNPELKSDMDAVLVNEAALKAFGLGNAENALKERIIIGGEDTVAILGVLKNYHWASLKTEHTPWIFKVDKICGRAYSLHLTGKNMPETIHQIEEKYKEAFAGNPFDYYFLDDFFNNLYKDEQQFASVFSLFAILAIVIACLGLWGLASFTTTQKLKEIGIRKVLGASAGSITSLLSWQFLKLVFIASAIAVPITWFVIDSWLDNFAFRVGLQWDLFIVPIFILAVVAFSTVSLQILRGASINPAKILRSE